LAVGLLGLGLAASGCGADSSDDDADVVRIGALLPYTGELAASGPNIEHAILWAAEIVNDAGGVAGKRVGIVARDSSSNVKRGMAVTRELIEEEGVVAIIGPEYDDLAREMLPLITKSKTIVISGGVTSPALTSLDTGEYWFRTTPTASAFGSVLGEAAFADGVRRLAIVYVNDEYGLSFARSVRWRFRQFEDTIVTMTPFATGARSYQSVVNEVAEFEPDGIALVAYPKSAAVIVADWTALGRRTKWYFSHTLRSDEFVQNVPPGSIEGMTGTSHSLPPGDVTVFTSKFRDRWAGETPLTASYFNYDALAILLLAIEEARVEYHTKGVPSTDQIRARLQSVSSSSRGKTVPWHSLALGLELVRKKDVPVYGGINYRGASGFLDLDEHGDIFAGLVQLWSVREGRVVGGKTVTPSVVYEE
jgi:ABC-type branched-subunit amino acid transport system substrate-binding protein